MDHHDIAERLFGAIEAGDLGTVADLYAPEIEIWHSYDGASQDREQNLAVLRWLTRHTADRRYEEIRRSATATGFVQQHVLRLETLDGRTVEVPACIVCTCVAGQITRVDEYLDSTHVARIAALASAAT